MNESRQSIATDADIGMDARTRLALDFGFVKARDGIGHSTIRTTLPVCRDRHDERLFARGTAASDAVITLAAKVGVVSLDEPAQLTRGLLARHRLHDLVLDAPGGPLANAQMARELQVGDVGLGLRQQIQSDKPGPKRQFGVGKDCADCRVGLVPAAAALEHLAIISRKSPRRTMLAEWADKAISPTRSLKSFLAALFVGKPIQETKKGQRTR